MMTQSEMIKLAAYHNIVLIHSSLAPNIIIIYHLLLSNSIYYIIC